MRRRNAGSHRLDRALLARTAGQAGGVVLVQLYEVSQSATLSLAWLTQHMGFPLATAMNVVLEDTHFKVDPSLMYLSQLATVVAQPMALDALMDMFSAKLAIVNAPG